MYSSGHVKTPRKKGSGVVPTALAQVYHGRGRESSREFSNEMSAVQTIKIRFEKMIEKDTKEIDVPNLFKHTSHKFFLADPELAIIPIDSNGKDQRIIKKHCISPKAKRIYKIILNTTDPSGK